MFHLIKFDESLDYESIENIENLKFYLSGIPNGTILSHGKIIYTVKNKWLVWIDKNNVERFTSLYNSFSKIKGITHFTPLQFIENSIYDSEWKWDDDYIKNIFLDNHVISEEDFYLQA